MSTWHQEKKNHLDAPSSLFVEKVFDLWFTYDLCPPWHQVRKKQLIVIFVSYGPYGSIARTHRAKLQAKMRTAKEAHEACRAARIAARLPLKSVDPKQEEEEERKEVEQAMEWEEEVDTKEKEEEEVDGVKKLAQAEMVEQCAIVDVICSEAEVELNRHIIHQERADLEAICDEPVQEKEDEVSSLSLAPMTTRPSWRLSKYPTMSIVGFRVLRRSSSSSFTLHALYENETIYMGLILESPQKITCPHELSANSIERIHRCWGVRINQVRL